MARPPIPSAGFPLYWEFASKRQQLYRAKLVGCSANGCLDDAALNNHRFTNPYRASDRVSQFLINRVLRPSETSWSWRDTFVRVLVFKIFNRIDTWAHLLDSIGEPDTDKLFSGAVEGAIADLADRQAVYSAAYLMPPPQSWRGPKYARHLNLIRAMVSDEADAEILAADRMEDAFRVLLRYESVGNFLAYQYITDLNYSDYLSFSESEFVVPGPGSLRGLRKCFTDTGGWSDPCLLKWTLDRQQEEFSARELQWDNLWGRELQLIDIQNLYCETDKYARVVMPALSAHAPGKRIKQRYKPNPTPLTAQFPPKWGINQQASAWLCQQAEQPPIFI